jgi:hypothetical protein
MSHSLDYVIYSLQNLASCKYKHSDNITNAIQCTSYGGGALT